MWSAGSEGNCDFRKKRKQERMLGRLAWHVEIDGAIWKEIFHGLGISFGK